MQTQHICRHKESTRWLIVIPFKIYLESFPKAIHFFSFLSLYKCRTMTDELGDFTYT